MNFLVDTSIFSALIREEPNVCARLTSVVPPNAAAICTIVKGEVAYGIARMASGKRRQALESRAEALFAAVACHPVPASAAVHYARIRFDQERKGLSLYENDLWIAASALALGMTLVSSDKDFLRVDGLALEDWTAST